MKTKKVKEQKKGIFVQVLKLIGKFLAISLVGCTLSLVLAVYIVNFLAYGLLAKQTPIFDHNTSLIGSCVAAIVVVVVAIMLIRMLYKLWKKGRAVRITISVLSIGSIFLLPLIISWLIVMMVFVLGINRDQPITPGDETLSLVKQLSGSVVYITSDDGPSAVSITSLPDQKTKQFNLPAAIYAVAGPDKEGRIIYYTEASGKGEVVRYTPEINTFETIASVKENPSIGNSLNLSLALSPSGNQLAFLNPMATTEHNPDEANLEIWDLTTKTKQQLNLTAKKGTLVWLSEDELLYTKDSPDPDLGKIYFYQLKNKTNTFFTDGDSPIMSPDRTKILYKRQDQFYLVDKFSRKVKEVFLPGNIDGKYIDFIGNNEILYWAAMTQQEASQRKSTPKTQTATLKVTNLTDGTFQTIVNNINPHDTSASFGY